MQGSLIYFIIFAIVFILNYFSTKLHKKTLRITLVIISFLILTIFVGLRSKVGTDYEAYIAEYEKTKALPWSDVFSQRTEFVVVLSYKVFANVFSSYHWIFFMYGALSILPIYLANQLFHNKYLPLSVLAYCLMFLPFTLNGMRQGVAMGFILLATACLMKKKYKASVVATIIAFLFHLSSLVFVPFPILYIYCKKKNHNYILFSAILTIFILIFLFISQNAGLYSGYLSKTSISNLSFGSLITYSPILIMTFLYNRKIFFSTTEQHG